MTYLVDSNIFIYATKPEDSVAYNWLLNNDNFFFSSITLIEVLGYNKLNSETKSNLKQIFSVGTELGISKNNDVSWRYCHCSNSDCKSSCFAYQKCG